MRRFNGADRRELKTKAALAEQWKQGEMAHHENFAD
jgi:hypothetical protein